jgi:DNA segregation ATPase FtsK/SpoIIIE, S-DNA-T family
VIVIDEFADLLDAYNYKDRDSIEKTLKRFGQMARACGIHIVIITQRATSTNIAGEIRTHLSGRIAFRMNTEADSYYILEGSGAEKLEHAGEFLIKRASEEVVQGYAPFLEQDSLVRMVKEMVAKYGKK